MTDICIPITHLGDAQIAEVVVSIGAVEQKHNFRVESFPWDHTLSSDERIKSLKNLIENYDKSWELVQIYNPSADADYIHVLFRMKPALGTARKII